MTDTADLIARLDEDANLVLERYAKLMREAAAALSDLSRWIHDLQSGMYVNCVYCGHRYGPQDKVPATMADALKDHIEQCPKHPMSALKVQLAAAERDARRLDKLEQLTEGGRDIHICRPKEHGGDPDGWLVAAINYRDPDVNEEWEGKTLRDAIDAALAEER